jgi:hypothetical protein
MRPAIPLCLLLLLAALSAGEAPSLLGADAFAERKETESASFLRFRVDEPGRTSSSTSAVAVTGMKALQISYRVRYAKVKRGDDPASGGAIRLTFSDAGGKALPLGTMAPFFAGSSDGWRKETMRFPVPAGAVTLTIAPGLFDARGGTLDLQDLAVVPIDPATVPTVDVVAEAVVDGGRPAPQALHVDGRRLLRADGSEIWLQGVSVDSLQWTNTGDATVATVATAIEVWKANVIRLPMIETRWFGTDKDQGDGGVAYRQVIDQAVRTASSRGAYLIIDLHRFGAPKDAHVAFWKACAEAYKDNPAVIFELFNEAHDISWEVWKHGGPVGGGKRTDPTVLAENAEPAVPEHSPGMQALVDAVRGTGARNLILAGGLDWSYDLTGITKGYALDDPHGNGVAYVTHVYPWKSGWQEKFIDASATYPVVMTEVGCDRTRYDFIPPERFENPYTWAPDMIACIQKNRIHWTAFSFHPRCGPPLLADQRDFGPTPFWGGFVRAALLGARFQSDRLR